MKEKSSIKIYTFESKDSPFSCYLDKLYYTVAILISLVGSQLTQLSPALVSEEVVAWDYGGVHSVPCYK